MDQVIGFGLIANNISVNQLTTIKLQTTYLVQKQIIISEHICILKSVKTNTGTYFEKKINSIKQSPL